MRNRVKITSDGINVYAELVVQSSKIGIGLLTTFILAVFISTIWFFVLKRPEGSIETAFLLLVFLVIFVGMPTRYLLWNIYGKENVMVSTKSINWYYDYGFVITNLNTAIYDRLGLGYESVEGDDDKGIGRLVFFNYPEETNFPVVIHRTTVLLSRVEIEELDQQISELFENDYSDENRFIRYSTNSNG